MAAKKKVSASKSRAQSVIDRFEGTIVEKPIVIANKTFLAGLGLVEQVRTDFETKFDALAKDGEKVRKQVRNESKDSYVSLRKKVEKQIKNTRSNVVKRVESAVTTILDYSPVATTGDVEKLNKKLDEVLVRVAK